MILSLSRSLVNLKGRGAPRGAPPFEPRVPFRSNLLPAQDDIQVFKQGLQFLLVVHLVL